MPYFRLSRAQTASSNSDLESIGIPSTLCKTLSHCRRAGAMPWVKLGFATKPVFPYQCDFQVELVGPLDYLKICIQGSIESPSTVMFTWIYGVSHPSRPLCESWLLLVSIVSTNRDCASTELPKRAKVVFEIKSSPIRIPSRRRFSLELVVIFIIRIHRPCFLLQLDTLPQSGFSARDEQFD